VLTASNSWSSGLQMLQKPPTYNTLRKTPCSLGQLTTGMGSAIWCFVTGAIYTPGIPMCWGHSTTFTMHHLLLSWVRSIQSRYPQAISLSFILILPYCPCLQSGLSPSCFPHQHPVHWEQSLNIYWSEVCFNKTVVKKTKTFYIHYLLTYSMEQSPSWEANQ